MKSILINLVLSLVLFTQAYADQDNGPFPKTPVLTETPGKLCSSPSAYRYPEKIAYCERNVDSYTKNAIIAKYDSLFGFRIRQMKRTDFKIDHLIPLCAGGSNSEENLWPQHVSVYNITDPLEPVLCEKMQAGRLTQKEAIKLIIEAKTNLKMAPVILKKLHSL